MEQVDEVKPAIDTSDKSTDAEQKPQAKKKLRKPVFRLVSSIKPGNESGFNLIVKALAYTEFTTIAHGRNLGKIAEITVGDKSGIVTLRLRNSHLDKSCVGKTFILRNVKTGMYQFHIRVEIDKWGKIEETEDIDFVNEENDLSKKQYSLVYPGKSHRNRCP